jgi:hypothetical protein
LSSRAGVFTGITVDSFPNSAGSPSSHCTRPNSNDVFATFTVFNIEEDRYTKGAGRIYFNITLDPVESHDIGLFIFEIKTTLVNLFGGVYVEFVLALHVLHVLFHLAEIGREGRPLLRTDN